MVIDHGLRRLALGTILGAFPGPAAPPWALSLLADGLAGYTLFGGNVETPEQLATLTAGLRAARGDMLVAIDEEGGDVTRLAHRTGSPYPGNAALGVIDDLELTREVYTAIGAELVAAGVTLDLAPVVDVNTADANPVIGTRSFGASTALVARHAAAAVVGLQEAGVAACAKHFPGHGATVTDSHLALPTVDVPVGVLRSRDLPPFAAAVAAGVRAIMTGHLRVPALTADDPATFSREALSLLRGELGFGGVVVTDALEMSGAVLAAGGIAQGAVRALDAGADLLCLGSRVNAGLIEAIATEIATAARDGRLALRRLEEAVSRTAEMASRSVPSGRALSPIGVAAARRAVGVPAAGRAVSASAARRAVSASAARRAVGASAARRAVRIEGSLDGFSAPLVVQLDAAQSIAAGRVPWGLAPHTSLADPSALPAGRPVVVVGRRLHNYPADRALIEQLAAARPVVVVEMGWPSSWRPAGVRAFVTTYGASWASGRAVMDLLGLD
ncbi:glycoside hydrolase family 3 N-terminal domain-containing protein [Actinoplanes sp. NPDC026619]|uniref:glycoside hydrolase family 3 N-terminal domain-containing protein n=1 Tax=Actinoplanes sp. NPDC026619 TaxID=3155798 RepID=UPI0033FE4601